MRSSLVQVRIEDGLKNRAVELFDNLGMDLSTAIRIFLKRSVLENGIPFKMTLPLQDMQTQSALYALKSLGEEADINGTSEMTLEEINAEITSSRQG